MSDPVPSKDQLPEVSLTPEQEARALAIVGDGFDMFESELRAARLIVHQHDEIQCLREDWMAEEKRLKAQVEELSVHAEKWVKRALGGAQPPSPIPFAGVAKGVSYEALANATYPERMYGGDSPAFACIGCGASVPGPNAYCEACFLRARRGARALAESAYKDGYGADMTDDRDLSERTHELIRSLSRPAHEREGPHCSSCSCGMTPEPGVRRCDDEHAPVYYDGDECPVCDVMQRWITEANAPRAAQPPGVDP